MKIEILNHLDHVVGEVECDPAKLDPIAVYALQVNAKTSRLKEAGYQWREANDDEKIARICSLVLGVNTFVGLREARIPLPRIFDMAALLCLITLKCAIRHTPKPCGSIARRLVQVSHEAQKEIRNP
jgi:hypothetical protein